MAPIRLAVIGCGLAATHLHWPALARLRRKFTVPVVCNHTEPKARAFAQLTGAPEYTLDWHEVLERDDIDAVDIILPVELNHPVTKAALKAGKHVLVEKPIATSLKEARAMIALAESHPSLVTMVAENFRFKPLFLRLRRELQSGLIGDVHSSLWNVLVDLDPDTSIWTTTRWRIEHKYPGGYLMDAGVHYVHALRMLFGEIRHVHSSVRQVNARIGKTDTQHMQYETETGHCGTFVHGFSSKGFSEDRLVIFGTTGTLVVEGGGITIKRRGGADRTIKPKDDGGYRGEFLDFHSAITNRHVPQVTFEEGFRDFAVIDASLKSAQTGRRIRL